MKKTPIDRLAAENIQIFRRVRLWSQRDLVERLAVVGWEMDQATLSRIEVGRRSLSIGELAAFAQVFSVTMEELLDEPRCPHCHKSLLSTRPQPPHAGVA